MNFDFHFMMIAMKEAIRYTPVTLLLAFVPFVLGILLGTLIALVRLFHVRILGRLMQVYIVITKGIPVILQILIIYFVMVQGFDTIADRFHWSLHSKDINVIYVALTALFTVAVANISETIRGALMAVNRGQYEAAYSVGMTHNQVLRRIILPQALPAALPMLCSNLIGIMKSTSLVFMISVVDLMNAALITATANYKYLEAYVAAAIVYWVLNGTIEKISLILEKRFSVYRKEGVF
ncbi:MAG TPA: amino acid ABC transporter permease [Firmicutes bacterium]|jgi:L-cystine transport system permease protein|nr:amino acid ABC transporter permease [Bacillota bacterium]